MELADTSAWTNRHKDATLQADFDARVLAGEIATCPPVVMELLWTARSVQELRALREELAALPQLTVNEDVWVRAADVWEHVAEAGRHRQVKWIDFVIAATAELAGVPVCHYDRDFELIAELTGQPDRALAPLGTI